MRYNESGSMLFFGEFNMTKKVAMITGGAQGIGKAISRRLSQDGFAVSIADLNKEKGNEVAADIEKNSGTAIAVKLESLTVETSLLLSKKSLKNWAGLMFWLIMRGLDQQLRSKRSLPNPLTKFTILM